MNWIPVSPGFLAATNDLSSQIMAKVEIDFTGTDVFVEIPADLVDDVRGEDRLEGKTGYAISNTLTIILDNSSKIFSKNLYSVYNPGLRQYNGLVQADSRGNLRPGRKIRVSVSVGEGNEYITRFLGYIDDSGFVEGIGAANSNKVTISCIDLGKKLKDAKLEVNGTTPVYLDVKISDPGDQANSLVHIIAGLAGLSPGDLDTEYILIEIPYAPLTGSAWEELAYLAEAALATLTITSGGKLFFGDSRYSPLYDIPISQFTFTNEHFSGINNPDAFGDIRNVITLKFAIPTWLENQIIWQFSENYNSSTGKTNYIIPAGDTTLDITNPAVEYAAQYGIHEAGKEFEVLACRNVDDQTAFESNLETLGGTLDVVVYDITKYPTKAVIRVANNEAVPVTLLIMKILGEPLVRDTQTESQALDLESIGIHGRKELIVENKYISNDVVLTAKKHWEDWLQYQLELKKTPRQKFTWSTKYPFLQAQVGARVTLTESLQGTGINEIGTVTRIGWRLTNGKAVLSFEMRWNLDSFDPPTTLIPTNTYEGANQDIVILNQEIADTPTYEEVYTGDLVGYPATPTTPAINSVSSIGTTIKVSVTPQPTVSTIKGIVIQVSSAVTGEPWYGPNLTGTGWSNGILNDVTIVRTNWEFSHEVPVPLIGSPPAPDPEGLTVWYRVAIKLRDGSLTSWSNPAMGISRAIGEIDLLNRAITAEKYAFQSIEADFLAMQNYLEPPPDESLVLYVSFDDVLTGDTTIIDHAQYNLPVNIIQGTIGTDIGVAGKAYKATGDTYIEIDSVIQHLLGDWLISIWIKVYPLPGTTYTIWSTNTVAGGNRIIASYDGTNGFARVFYNSTVYVIPVDIRDDTYHQLVVEKESTTIRTYLDTNLKHADILTDDIQATDTFSLCQEFDGVSPTDFFDGSIDEFRVYDIALSLKQRYYLFGAPEGPKQTMVSENQVETDAITARTINVLNLIANKILTGSMFATRLSAEYLSVLALNFVNDPTISGYINVPNDDPSWGFNSSNVALTLTTQIIDGINTPVLQMENDGSEAITSKVFEIKPNEIYEVTMRVKKEVAVGSNYLGIWTGNTIPVSNPFISPIGDIGLDTTTALVMERWTVQADGSKVKVLSDINNIYLDSNFLTTSWVTIKSYIVGYNRSVDECFDVSGVGYGTLIYVSRIIDPTTKYCYLRFLNWDNGATVTKTWVRDISVNLAGAGVILAKQVRADQVLANTVQSINYTPGSIGYQWNKDGTWEASQSPISYIRALLGKPVEIAGTLIVGDGSTAVASQNLVVNDGQILFNGRLDIADGNKPAGPVNAYDNTDPTTLSFVTTSPQKGLKLYSATDSSIGVTFQAIGIKTGVKKYRVRASLKSDQVAVTGLYFRLEELDTELPVGKTHISNNAGTSNPVVTEDTREITFVSNGPITTSYVTYEYDYIPTATAKYFSILFLNWTGMGLTELHVDWIEVTEVWADNVSDGADVGRPGIACKVNYESFITPNPGEIYTHGYDQSGLPADVDGYITYRGEILPVLKGIINPNAIVDGFLIVNRTTNVASIAKIENSVFKTIGGTILASADYAVFGRMKNSAAEVTDFATVEQDGKSFEEVINEVLYPHVAAGTPAVNGAYVGSDKIGIFANSAWKTYQAVDGSLYGGNGGYTFGSDTFFYWNAGSAQLQLSGDVLISGTIEAGSTIWGAAYQFKVDNTGVYCTNYDQTDPLKPDPSSVRTVIDSNDIRFQYFSTQWNNIYELNKEGIKKYPGGEYEGFRITDLNNLSLFLGGDPLGRFGISSPQDIIISSKLILGNSLQIGNGATIREKRTVAITITGNNVVLATTFVGSVNPVYMGVTIVENNTNDRFAIKAYQVASGGNAQVWFRNTNAGDISVRAILEQQA